MLRDHVAAKHDKSTFEVCAGSHLLRRIENARCRDALCEHNLRMLSENRCLTIVASMAQSGCCSLDTLYACRFASQAMVRREVL